MYYINIKKKISITLAICDIITIIHVIYHMLTTIICN